MRFANEILLLWLTACAWSDWRARRVPNGWTYGMGLLAAGALIVLGNTLLGQPAWVGWAGALTALLMTLPGFLSGKLGGGDVKLLLALGLACGPMILLMTLVAALPCLMLWSVAMRDPAARKPMVPALAAGYVLARWVSASGWL